jgi:hypothetical protein
MDVWCMKLMKTFKIFFYSIYIYVFLSYEIILVRLFPQSTITIIMPVTAVYYSGRDKQ